MVQFIMTSFSEGIPILSASLSKASISSWVGMSSGSNNPFSISFSVAFLRTSGGIWLRILTGKMDSLDRSADSDSLSAISLSVLGIRNKWLI